MKDTLVVVAKPLDSTQGNVYVIIAFCRHTSLEKLET